MAAPIIQFDDVEVDLRKFEVRRRGRRVHLEKQPFDLLILLLRNPGDLISRKQIAESLWSPEVFVETDRSINNAIRKIRLALRDDPENPRFIETVAGRGYRFIATVSLSAGSQPKSISEQVVIPMDSEALGDSSESPRFIKTIARRGYQFIAPVTITPPLPAAKSPEPTDQSSRAPRRLDFRRVLTSVLAGLLGGALLLTLVFTFDIAGAKKWLRRRTAKSVQVQRITDFVGVKESPAISPDGKTVAFVAPVNGRKQIWIRLLAGGLPLQLTHGDADHEQPRWTPDSSSLIYYALDPSPGGPGTIWELSALGGVARKIAAAVSGADVSHDGRRIAAFQLRGADVALVTMSQDGTMLREIKRFPQAYGYATPRWSPDDRWIAYLRSWGDAFDLAIQVIAVEGGQPRDVAHSEILRGFSWLADGSRLVYSSSSGSTILYPPIFNLRVVGRTGSDDRQLTFGEVSYVEPDLAAGRLAASRVRIQSDIWRMPVSGSPLQNTKDAQRITLQTGQAQTPAVSPDGKEVVYLSDSGGHGNLWVAATDGSRTRQITFEQDPAVVIGVPIWSPAGEHIVFIRTLQGRTAEWIVGPDGSSSRQLVPLGSGACWSPDGKWLYYQREHCIEKIPVNGGAAVRVRCQNSPFVEGFSPDGSILYYVNSVQNEFGGIEIWKASPENGPSELLARIPASRLPFDGWLWQQVMSPDGNWLAGPLMDGGTTNLWAMPVHGGPMRPITDFGQRSVVIVRRISWSPDGKYIYAAVADTDADIVLLDGLLP